MSETALSILVFLHLIFIAVWVGSQVLVAAAVVPSLRRISGGEDRVAALEHFTRRFNHVAWGSMILIVITGGLMVSERIDQAKVFGDSILDARWGWIFVIKMTLWVLMLGAVAAHSFLVGPRQLELNRQAQPLLLAAVNPDDAAPGLRRLRVLREVECQFYHRVFGDRGLRLYNAADRCDVCSRSG